MKPGLPYQIIDAHHHFWHYDPTRDSWITNEMQVLQKDFLPQDLKTVFQQHQISGSIVVQQDQSEAENRYLLDLAEKNSFVRGVVGWVDLQSDNLEESLSFYKSFPRLKGFRHVLQGEKQRDRMLYPAFQKGIGLLNSFDYSYDILIYPDQLDFTEKLVANFPDQRFVIDHLAKPAIKTGKIHDWIQAIRRFSKYPHVFCKISGMVTEADWINWKTDQFRPCMDAVLETFGTRRIMFGSDWPVCLLAGTYEEVLEITKKYFSSFSLTEQADFSIQKGSWMSRK